MSWSFPQFNLPMFGNNNPMFDTTFSTTQRRGPFGSFGSMTYSNNLNTFGKATILGQLGSGIANIFLNKSNLNPIQKFNIGINTGVYGLLNNNGFGGVGGGAIAQGPQRDLSNLKAIYNKYTIIDNGNGTYSLTKGDGKIYKTGTFEELKKAAEKAGETSQGINDNETKAKEKEDKKTVTPSQDSKQPTVTKKEDDKKTENEQKTEDKTKTKTPTTTNKYVVANGETIDGIAIKVLKKQGKTNPTRQEINEVKAQIIKDNQNAVKAYPNGNQYFLVGSTINISADIGTNDAKAEIDKYVALRQSRRTQT